MELESEYGYITITSLHWGHFWIVTAIQTIMPVTSRRNVATQFTQISPPHPSKFHYILQYDHACWWNPAITSQYILTLLVIPPPFVILIWACPKISNPTCWLFIPYSQTDPYVNPVIIQQRTPPDMDPFPSPAVPRWWPRSVPAVEWASSEVHATLNRLWRYLPYKYPYTISMYGLCNTDISKSSKYGYSEYWGELYWILELQKNTVSLFTAHIL